MRHPNRHFALRSMIPLLTAGCFQIVHSPVCETLGSAVVDDSGDTPAGTASALLDQVELDAAVDGAWHDDQAVEVQLLVARGVGDAAWVEQRVTTLKRRSWGVGNTYHTIAGLCEDQLQVPLTASVRTADGTLEILAEGVAARSAAPSSVTAPSPDPSADAQVTTAFLQGPFDEAVFPPTLHSPSDYDWLDSFLALHYDADGLLDGSAGWLGHSNDGESIDAVTEHVVTFARSAD